MQKTDLLMENAIKDSYIWQLISRLRLNIIPGKDIINSLILIFTTLTFISLSLPQFADDKKGIGILMMVCIILSFINFILSKDIVFKPCFLDTIFVIFLCILIISTFSSLFFHASLTGLIKYLLFIFFYFSLKAFILNTTNKSFVFLWGILFISSVIISCIGIVQYMHGVQPLANWSDTNLDTNKIRAYSTMLNPNLLAGFLVTITPVNFILPFAFNFKLLPRLLFLTGSILNIICLIFTQSRGGYLGFFVSIFFLLVILIINLFPSGRLSNKFLKLITLFAISGLFITILILMFPDLPGRLLTIFALREHSSNNYRINVWLSCIQIFKDNFIAGVGPGNETFRLVYGLYMKTRFEALGAYNIFLEIAVETGILGLLTFVLICFISLIKLHYYFWHEKQLLALGIFASLIASIVHGMVDTILFRPQVFIPFFFLLASIAKLDITRERN